MTFMRYFLYIVGAALLSAALGGGFACLIAFISPEFVAELFFRTGAPQPQSIIRYAAAVGMIGGLFHGAACMAFSLLLVTVQNVGRLAREKSDGRAG
jgi:hypothetical protein